MPSTYTSNGGIEKIGLGEKAGAWGTTTNNNFDIIDRLTNGVGAITLSGTTHTLTTSDGSLSDGMFKVLVLGGSPSGTNTITKSRYYPVRQIDWDDRALILDGKTPQRTISFGDDGFVYAPQLGKDEKLIIEWRGERHFESSDYFSGSTKDIEEVVFDQREAKAVAEYTKAHLQREVDKDLNMYKSHWSQYQKERQEIYRERREHKPTSLTNPYPVSTAQVGPYQVN